MAKQLTQEQEKQLNSLRSKIKTANTTASTVSFDSMWPFLQGSETILMDLMNNEQPSSSMFGDAETGLLLYTLNNLQNGDFIDQTIYDILNWLNMPASNITPALYSQYTTTLADSPGIVAGDGTYLTTYTYGAFDEGWQLGGIEYILLVLGQVGAMIGGDIGDAIAFLQQLDVIPTLHAFVENNSISQIGTTKSSISIAVFGDYGADNQNASLVLGAMQSLNPDVYIHLGDVYYSGLSWEETDNLVTPFQNITKPKYTLNSNHEMFSGANGYFETALANTAFSSQNGASYFAIEYGNWVLLGLDSAYFDTQSLENLDLFLNGALLDPATGASNPQSEYVSGLNLNGKQLIVFTHHNGISLDGTTQNNPLLDQLGTILGNRYPDYWYYGHIHNGVVYSNPPALNGLTTASGNTPQLRCCGHAALPYGIPYFLQAQGLTGIDYFAQTSAGNTNTQLSNTVRNGFAIITLTGNQISEAFYEVNLDGTYELMWTS